MTVIRRQTAVHHTSAYPEIMAEASNGNRTVNVVPLFRKTRFMKKIIIYYSFTGNNESLYRELQRRLNCEAFRILEPKRRTWLTILLDMLFDRRPRIELFPVDLRKYDMVILMSPVWNAHIANPMKSFIDKEKDHLKEYAFLTVCGGRQGQKEKLLQELKLLTGKTPAAVAELRDRQAACGRG